MIAQKKEMPSNKIRGMPYRTISSLSGQQWKIKQYIGLVILAAKPGGENRVIEHSVSAAFACTSGQSCGKKSMYLFNTWQSLHITYERLLNINLECE